MLHDIGRTSFVKKILVPVLVLLSNDLCVKIRLEDGAASLKRPFATANVAYDRTT